MLNNQKTITTDVHSEKEKLVENAIQLSTIALRELPSEEIALSSLHPPRSPFDWIPPKWEMRVRLGTFKNIGNSSNPDSYLSPYTWQEVSEPAPEAYTENYKRFAEFQIDVDRRIGRKFHLSGGLSTSFSQNRAGTPNGDTSFTLNQLSFGIPMEIGYMVVNYKRFAVKPFLGILNEFNNYIQRTSVVISDNAIPGEEVIETGGTFENGYNLGLQPSVEIYYYMNENTSLSLTCGYRKYVAGRTNGNSPGIRQPDYFQSAIGISWILR